jgi:hypothetical protein
MELGEPIRIITVEPATIPVPQWEPDRREVEEPVLEPQKVGE